MYVWFFLVPQVAKFSDWEPLIYITTLKPFVVGVFALAVNYSAYEAEIFRAGLQAIPRGQMEAALSLGMSPLTAVRRVMLPQAVRIVIPPVTNDFIALFKDTSVCSLILITELTGLYYQNKYDRDLVLPLAATIGGTVFVDELSAIAVVACGSKTIYAGLGGDTDDRDIRLDQEIRQVHHPRRHLARRQARRGGGGHWAVGWRQEHLAMLHQRAGTVRER